MSREETLSTRFDLGSSRREFVKLNSDIPIRYKFLSKTLDLGEDQIFEGTTNSLSGGGAVLQGRVPNLNWMAALLMGRIHVGVNLLLPSTDQPIKALCTVNWLGQIPEGSDRCTMGLLFDDIDKEQQDHILKHLIKAQMTK